MSKAIITLKYRQVYDAASEGALANNILHYTYEEFKLKSQVYNPGLGYTTFTEMKAADGRANSLHYKCGFAISGLMQSFQHIIPNLTDTLGQPIRFSYWQLELLESHIHNRLLHQVAIDFVMDNIILCNSFADKLLLSYNLKEAATDMLDTFILPLQPSLSICNYRETDA
jgi:hypothetical protein